MVTEKVTSQPAEVIQRHMVNNAYDELAAVCSIFAEIFREASDRELKKTESTHE